MSGVSTCLGSIGSTWSSLPFHAWLTLIDRSQKHVRAKHKPAAVQIFRKHYKNVIMFTIFGILTLWPIKPGSPTLPGRPRIPWQERTGDSEGTSDRRAPSLLGISTPSTLNEHRMSLCEFSFIILCYLSELFFTLCNHYCCDIVS